VDKRLPSAMSALSGGRQLRPGESSSTSVTVSHFNTIQPKILKAFQSFLQTPYARDLRIPRELSAPETYEQMISYDPVRAECLPGGDLSSLLLTTDKIEGFSTTGTHGTPRVVYLPSDPAKPVSHLLDRTDPGDRITVTHTSAIVDTDLFLKAHLEGFRRADRNLAVKDFATATDVSEILLSSDAVILFDYPAAFARFVRLAKMAADSGALSKRDMAKTKLIALLTGEPMNTEDLSAWHTRARDLGLVPVIELGYGCTELEGIGMSTFEPNTPFVEYRLTDQDCFAEVLNPDSRQPIYEGRGVLCATSFRTSGTIFFRYVLGDHVDIFERAGERYIRNISRPDSLIVVGSTVSLSDFIATARRAIGLEICLDTTKTTDPTSGVQRVKVVVSVPDSSRADMIAAGDHVEHMLIEQLKLGPALTAGHVVLDVHAEASSSANGRRRKAWRLVT
jgi:hypothetical protein